VGVSSTSALKHLKCNYFVVWKRIHTDDRPHQLSFFLHTKRSQITKSQTIRISLTLNLTGQYLLVYSAETAYRVNNIHHPSASDIVDVDITQILRVSHGFDSEAEGCENFL
jgi:hypothetical protein